MFDFEKLIVYQRAKDFRARGSLIECVAILDLLQSEEIISAEKYKTFYFKAEEISKMLYAMIRESEGNSLKKN